ncbi:transaldolase [Ferroacidibacillus organovorans]|uniref:Transaldolase n=1 Tax=Ferroacidibacillus organovorans TaxID=1765683 RepID=A0A101XT55_9BACL|nr:transaldolase [Ferroacidibacillus organovorans]KUO97093.1 hypothetical protein ATW55_12320 [Ferroacidibacillus organovorans]
MTTLHELHKLGQSAWLDYIRSDLFTTGEMSALLERGVRGMTSNPTIFEQAIGHSDLYRAKISALASRGKSAQEIYDALVFADIKAAAQSLLPLYEATDGEDGYVSLEVPPAFCDNHNQTEAEAHRLVQLLNLPNLMIKVPATPEGLVAFENLTADGVSVNVTLMFTLSDYEDVANAYLCGLSRRLKNGQALRTVSSVASVFVSRIDAAVESLKGDALPDLLKGSVAIANAQRIYQSFQEIFEGDAFAELRANSARPQRPLFASTGTKNAAYRDVLYVETLIGPHTVNTMPPATLRAFLDHGVVKRTLDENPAHTKEILDACASASIDLDAIGRDLKKKGLDAFTKSFDSLMETIETARTSSLS